MFAGEHLPCPAESNSNFVGDQQNIIFVAERAHLAKNTLWPDNHAACALDDRLNDQGSNALVMFFESLIARALPETGVGVNVAVRVGALFYIEPKGTICIYGIFYR